MTLYAWGYHNATCMLYLAVLMLKAHRRENLTINVENMIIIICLQGHKEKSISERNRRRERDIFSMSIVFLGDIYKQFIDYTLNWVELF